MAEVSLPTVVIGQSPMIHDLQQQIKDVRMCFFYLVKQQDTMWIFRDRFGQQPTLIKAYIARRRTDETTDRMPLHVFRHIKANQLNTERPR